MKLVGSCNRCGWCCVSDGYRCLNLGGQLFGPFKAHTPDAPATTCLAYNQRYDGMPIAMVNAQGLLRIGMCRKDSPGETNAIIQNGFNRGCSLKVSNDE